ncbi:hypothetical protein HUJ04_004552 [Dendroctonus ponderosae]|nr:hypothetical protein HUJ04_004552 [Dendroctonus ponderosae]
MKLLCTAMKQIGLEDATLIDVLPTWNAKKDGNISFKFRTNEPYGLILFNSGKPPRFRIIGGKRCNATGIFRYLTDLFAVEIYNGQIYIQIDLGAGPSKQRGSKKRINDGAWHNVTFRRVGRDAQMSVDGLKTDFKAMGKNSKGSATLELDSNLYIGGLGPPFSDVPVPAGLWTAALHQGFVGCFKDLVLNNEPIDVASFATEQDFGKCHSNYSVAMMRIVCCTKSENYSVPVLGPHRSETLRRILIIECRLEST